MESEILAPYVLDRMIFGDRFELLAGARFDRVKVDGTGTGTVADRTDEEVSPFVGVVLHATGEWSLHAQYSSSFEPPSSLTIGEAEPQEGEQMELGLRYVAGTTTASLAFYELDKSNIAIPSQFGVLRRNGDQKSRGAELELTGRTASELAWRFSYAYTDAELVRFSEFVQTAPGFRVRRLLRATCPPSRRRTSPASGFRSVSKAASASASAAATSASSGWTTPTPGKSTTRFSSTRRFSTSANKLQLNVAVENIGDEETFTRAFSQQSVVPAAGTTFKGGIRLVL